MSLPLTWAKDWGSGRTPMSGSLVCREWTVTDSQYRKVKLIQNHCTCLPWNSNIHNKLLKQVEDALSSENLLAGADRSILYQTLMSLFFPFFPPLCLFFPPSFLSENASAFQATLTSEQLSQIKSPGATRTELPRPNPGAVYISPPFSNRI